MISEIIEAFGTNPRFLFLIGFAEPTLYLPLKNIYQMWETKMAKKHSKVFFSLFKGVSSYGANP